jgi:hypothetical protein
MTKKDVKKKCEKITKCQVCEFFSWHCPKMEEDFMVGWCTLFNRAIQDVKVEEEP